MKLYPQPIFPTPIADLRLVLTGLRRSALFMKHKQEMRQESGAQNQSSGR
jgi:hypothetical protein